MPVGARTGGDTLNHLSMARAGPQQRACHAPARCGAVSPHVCADLCVRSAPQGRQRTLLSWLHRVPATPCRARENRACPSDTVSPSSDIPRACTDTAARFYIVQNNMQYSDAHRRYKFVRGGLSLTRLGTLYAMYCTILLVSQYIGQQAAPLRLRPPRTYARLAQARGHERAPREPSANSDAPNRAGPLLAARRARNLGGRTL